MIVASVGAGTVIVLLLSAFVTGAFARLAVPGPDPMPVWLTVLIGLIGSLGGGGIVYLAGWRNAYAINTVGFAVAILLVVGYRRFVQRRPVTGRGAYRFPERGFGIEQYRQRLQRAGIDPDKLGTQGGPFVPGAVPQPAPAGPPPAPAAGEPGDNPAHYLRLLEELHDAGVIDDDEYAASKSRLLESLR